MKKWTARLLALALCFVLVLCEGSVVSAAETVGDSIEVATEETTEETSSVEVSEVVEEESKTISEESVEEESEAISEEVAEEESEMLSDEITEEGDVEASEETNEEKCEETSECVTEETKLFPGLPAAYVMGKNEVLQREELQQNINSAVAGEEGESYIANQILVVAENENQAELFAQAYGGELLQYAVGVAVIKLNKNEETTISVKEAVLASLNPVNNLPVAWPNTIHQKCEADPALDVAHSSYQWQHDVTDSTYAWEEGYTGKGVTVAVLDTGIRIGHEDLNPAKVHCTTGDKEEYFYMEGVEFTPDDIYDGHGTHVSGIIAAKAGNGKGGAGIAPDVTLLSCNVFLPDSTCAADDVIEGIEWAMQNGADIINMSLGSNTYNGAFAAAVKNAYESGVAVFCAAGNDATSSYHYPASYSGAIGIAALDVGLQKWGFSNYCDKVRYAFPGVDIYSAISGEDSNNDGILEATTDSYGMMSGTSMASPVGAGVAAVALQYAKENGKMNNLTGAAKVKKLLSIMDSAAIPIATKGLGKGCISLSKLTGAAVYEGIPAKPVIIENGAGKYTDEFIDVSFAQKKDIIVCYTTDGKTPKFAAGEPVGTTRIASPHAIVGGKKNITLKAIAVNPYTGLCSKVVTAKYTFSPAPKKIVFSDSSVQAVLVQGDSLTLKATVEPSYASNTKINWRISAVPKSGVTISSKGVVKVSKNAEPGMYGVTATSAANENVYAVFMIMVKKIEKNIVSINCDETSYKIPLGGRVEVEGLVIKTNDESEVFASDLAWNSANKNIAVAFRSGNSVFLSGLKTGKTKITAMAKDGSKKKIAFTVNVYQPMEGVKVNGPDIVAIGKSITLVPEASNKAVKASDFEWKISSSESGLTIKNGKIKVSKNVTPGDYVITVVPKDGSNQVIYKNITVTDNSAKAIKVDRAYKDVIAVRGGGYVAFPISLEGGNPYLSYEVTAKNPALVKNTYIVYQDDEGIYYLCIEPGNTAGNTKVIVKSVDGTNVSLSINVTISNPVSKMKLTFPDGRSQCLAYTKSMKLVPVFSSEKGTTKNVEKTLIWESMYPDVISVDEKGVITALANEGGSSIRAYSPVYGIEAEIYIYVSDLIKDAKIHIVDNHLELDENGDEIEVGYVLIEITTSDGKKKYLDPKAVLFIDSQANKEGIAFRYLNVSFEEYGGPYIGAQYLIQKPGTYTGTFRFKDGNTIKLKHKFKFRR